MLPLGDREIGDGRPPLSFYKGRVKGGGGVENTQREDTKD